MLLRKRIARHACHRQGKIAEHRSWSDLIDSHMAYADRALNLIGPGMAFEVIVEGAVTAIEILRLIVFLMTMAIQSRIARVRASVGVFALSADASSARLSNSRSVHLISTRGRTTSGTTRSSRGKSSALRSPLALSLTIRRPNFRSDTAHRNRARASHRKSVLLVSCNSSLRRRTARSSAGARSACNLALRRRLIAGASIRFVLDFKAVCLPSIPWMYDHSN